MLAALIGAPLCCCAYETKAQAAESRSSCCHASPPAQDGQQQPKNHICSCRSKDPRESAKELKVPGNQEIDIAAPVMERIVLMPLEPMSPLTVRYVHTGSDPPTRLRLARLSRWLN